MKTYEEIVSSSVFTDDELSHAITLLSVALAALEPLGSRYRLALDDMRWRHNQLESIWRMRRQDDARKADLRTGSSPL